MLILFFLAVIGLGAVVIKLRNQVKLLTADLAKQRSRLDALVGGELATPLNIEDELSDRSTDELQPAIPADPWVAAKEQSRSAEREEPRLTADDARSDTETAAELDAHNRPIRCVWLRRFLFLTQR